MGDDSSGEKEGSEVQSQTESVELNEQMGARASAAASVQEEPAVPDTPPGDEQEQDARRFCR